MIKAEINMKSINGWKINKETYKICWRELNYMVKRKVRLTIGECECFMNAVMQNYNNRVAYANC